MDHFSLKKRKYVGNTSMEAEISLLMANAGLCSENKLVYDPFVGTGSMLHTCAYFGAWVMGSDIDGRQIRGRKEGTEKSILGTAKQYGIEDKFLDFFTMDLTNRGWRDGAFEGLFDAIVTDRELELRLFFSNCVMTYIYVCVCILFFYSAVWSQSWRKEIGTK